jgi:hypothetical protein
VTPGLTRNADIIIPGAVVNATYELSNLDPATATVDESDDPINISAAIENTGLDDGAQDVTLEVTNQSGDIVYSETKSNFVVAAGDNVTGEFMDVPAGDLSPGDYTHTIETEEDDSISGTLTVNGTENGGSDVPSWATSYVDDDGVATLTGASDAISDFSDGDLGLIRASNIIESYNTQTTIQDIY